MRKTSTKLLNKKLVSTSNSNRVLPIYDTAKFKYTSPEYREKNTMVSSNTGDNVKVIKE